MRVYRVLRGSVRPCGCLVGVYETFDGGTVGIIDERGINCSDLSHRVGRPIAPPTPPTDSLPFDSESSVPRDVAHIG